MTVATAAHTHLTDCKDYCPTSLYTPATTTSLASPVNSHDHSPYLQTVLHLPKSDSIPYLLCSHCKASPVLLSSQSLHHLVLNKWSIISRYSNPHYFTAMVAFSLLAYIQVEEVGLVNCSPSNHLPTHTPPAYNPVFQRICYPALSFTTPHEQLEILHS